MRKTERIEEERQKRVKLGEKHKVQEGCPQTCQQKCREISEDMRLQMNHNYWALDWERQKAFVLERVTRQPASKRSRGSKKTASYTYTLRKPDGQSVKVCKVFFLTSLGYKKNNDTLITNLFKKITNEDQSVPSATVDGRGRYEKEILQILLSVSNLQVARQRRCHIGISEHGRKETVHTGLETWSPESNLRTSFLLSFGKAQRICLLGQ